MIWGAPIPVDDPVPGVNERCVEIPLGLDLCRFDQPIRILDAGCALNGAIPEDGVQADVWHLTQHLASENLMIPRAAGMTRSYVAADLRNLSVFASGAFTTTVCVSTLEHVGLDNRGYGGAAEACPDTMLDAVRELCRVTRSAILITVPFLDPPRGNARWRYFGYTTLGRMVALAIKYGFQSDVRFYGKATGGWYGGGASPVPLNASLPGVNAIACLRWTR